jgi:enoyl-CoA hydratase
MAGLAGSPDGNSGPPVSMAARARSARAQILRMQQSVTSVADCPLPVIAAIHGYCIGGGVDLAAACDIRLASGDAVLSVRETKLAIVADLGSLQRLPSIIGRGHVA